MVHMWSNMWSLHLSVGEKVLRAVVIYLFLVVALRLAGKRELAQLNTLDFIVLLAVANAVQNGLIGNDNSVTGALVGAAVLFVLNGALAFVLFRASRLRKLAEGTPTVLIRDGVVDRAAMRKQEISDEDLLTEVQSAGASKVDEVQTASLEPSGKVVVIPKQPDQSTKQYRDLVRRIDELGGLVRELQGGTAPPERA
ncbi:MAG: DUF421 domain-containing protein [Pseudonocardiales bacterium]|nr:MAG: DUF421 domain-containing protein [Pseudonocardiales bacterium]